MSPELPERPIIRDEDIVFLIHGTFAASSEWINSNSLITNSLRAVAAVTVVPFRWSGDNSHTARLTAGFALEQAALRLASLHPNAGFHFIGHSHGGNVALYALRNTDLSLRTRSVTFLGTPFIQLNKRELEKPIRFFAQIFSIFATLRPSSLVLAPLGIPRPRRRTSHPKRHPGEAHTSFGPAALARLASGASSPASSSSCRRMARTRQKTSFLA